MWSVHCEPFKGAVITVGSTEVSIPLGAAGTDIAEKLTSVCTDIEVSPEIIYALENSLQIHLANGAVAAIEIYLKEGPSSVHCLGRDYVHDLGNDIISDLEKVSSGDTLFADVYIDCGIAIWRPVDPAELTEEYEELLSDDSWEGEFDSLSEFEEYYRGEIHRAQYLSAVLIGTAAYFESYREIQQ
ncbi:MAG: hypothetical protein Q4C87_08665 [Actinomycetaceae bacterium]|nr:hypothetical protein [Actinomycetaceae bacterium]